MIALAKTNCRARIKSGFCVTWILAPRVIHRSRLRRPYTELSFPNRLWPLWSISQTARGGEDSNAGELPTEYQATFVALNFDATNKPNLSTQDCCMHEMDF